MKALFGQMFRQVPGKFSIAFTWLIQLGAVTQRLEVGRK